MSKKKVTTNEKRLRRELELLKAQLKTGVVEKYASPIVLATSEPGAKPKTEKAEKYELPIYSIKKDLIKTLLFAVFAVGILGVLNITKVSL